MNVGGQQMSKSPTQCWPRCRGRSRKPLSEPMSQVDSPMCSRLGCRGRSQVPHAAPTRRGQSKGYRGMGNDPFCRTHAFGGDGSAPGSTTTAGRILRWVLERMANGCHVGRMTQVARGGSPPWAGGERGPPSRETCRHRGRDARFYSPPVGDKCRMRVLLSSCAYNM